MQAISNNPTAHQTAMDLLASVTGGLTTTSNKGVVRDFERSIAFASKDGRWEMSATLWLNQAKAGRYGKLIHAALAEGVVSKGEARVFTALFDVNPSKEQARMFCKAVKEFTDEAIAAGKAPKGKKQYLINLIGALSVLVGTEDSVQSDANRTIEA